MKYPVLHRTIRSAAALLAFAGLAACDDDGSGPGERLQPEEISAIYRVCQLTFDPAGSVVPPVNIREAAFEITGAGIDPVIGLDPDAQRTVELTYVPKGQVTDREIRGSYDIKSLTTVQIRFNSSGVDPKPLLLPDDRGLDFEFQDDPQTLALASSSQYSVARSDYVELSGEDPQNLPDRITGVLIAEFRNAACGG